MPYFERENRVCRVLTVCTQKTLFWGVLEREKYVCKKWEKRGAEKERVGSGEWEYIRREDQARN
jgi:hypothetical protein